MYLDKVKIEPFIHSTRGTFYMPMINNNVKNLEWCTHQHNSYHSLGKKVQQLDIETGTVLKTFESLTHAFKSLNITKGNPWGIGRVCSGKQETSYGYKWKFV